MSRFGFGDSIEIKPAETVWILAPGPSLDLFDFKLIKPVDIVITCNSALSTYTDADFQIGSDIAAVNGYAKYCKEKTYWISKTENAEVLFGKGIKFLDMKDLVTRRFRGTGAESILLAYYLTVCQPTIKRINYAGLDFVELINAGKTYYYASRVEALPHQKPSQLPKGWHKNKIYQVTYAALNSYNAQRKYTLESLLHIPEFKKMLISYSYFDFNLGQLPDLTKFPQRHNLTSPS